MDQYFNQMDKIIKERKTSSRIRFMLQDVLDLRRVNIKSHYNKELVLMVLLFELNSIILCKAWEVL